MKVWKRVRFLKKDKKIDMITKSYVNYIYENSPINDVVLQLMWHRLYIQKAIDTLK